MISEGARIAGGNLCRKAEAPTEPAGEPRPYLIIYAKSKSINF